VISQEFQNGEKVFDLRWGNGIVSNVVDDDVTVYFDKDKIMTYHKNGFCRHSDKFKSLYHGHDLIVSVKEPIFEWQFVLRDAKENIFWMSTEFYKSIDEAKANTNRTIDFIAAYEPSKRLVNHVHD
jgi:hypothetical protein